MLKPWFWMRPMKCLIWASWKILRPSSAMFLMSAKPYFSQLPCLMPSSELVSNSWKSLSMSRLRLRSWPAIMLSNSTSVLRNAKNLIPWPDWLISNNQNCRSSLVGPNVGWMNWPVASSCGVTEQKESMATWTKTSVCGLFVILKTIIWISSWPPMWLPAASIFLA